MTISFSPPLNRRYPNRGRALEEGMPALCAILFGFSGAYFVGVATVDTQAFKHSMSTADLYLVGPLLGHFLQVPVGVLVMALTALSSAAFYISAVSAVRAKMLNTDDVKGDLPINRSSEQIELDDKVISLRTSERERLLDLGLTAFNCGVFLLPLALFALLPVTAFVLLTALFLFYFLLQMFPLSDGT